MNYYRPTSFTERVKKILQLYWNFFTRDIASKQAIALQPLSILMIVPQLDRLGGYERQALELSGSLVQGGNLVMIVTEQRGKFPSREFRNGFLIHRLNGTGIFFLARLLGFLFARRSRVHVVHCHGVTGFTLIASRIAKMLVQPVVLKAATRDDVRSIFQSKSVKCVLYRSWFRKIDRWIAISTELKEEILSCDIPEERIIRIPNAVHHEKFTALPSEQKNVLRAEAGITSDQTVFLFVGRLEKRKGVDVLLHAWQKQEVGVLWIVGAGQEEPNLKKLSEDLGLSRVKFFGTTLNPLTYYQTADVFVFPSLKEGFPNVLLEAMSCGLPCISTEIGGVADILKEDLQGILVPPNDPDRLSGAMIRMASSSGDRLRWSQAAAKTVRDQYDFSVITGLYISLYSGLMR